MVPSAHAPLLLLSLFVILLYLGRRILRVYENFGILRDAPAFFLLYKSPPASPFIFSFFTSVFFNSYCLLYYHDPYSKIKMGHFGRKYVLYSALLMPDSRCLISARCNGTFGPRETHAAASRLRSVERRLGIARLTRYNWSRCHSLRFVLILLRSFSLNQKKNANSG